MITTAENTTVFFVKKRNKQFYNFCDLAFKIIKDVPTTKIINYNKQLYLINHMQAMKFMIKRETGFMDCVLYEAPGYYHLSKNADGSYMLSLDEPIQFDEFFSRNYSF